MSHEACETLFGICSGHGECINNTCHCDDGWSGYGDLLDRTPYDCNVNKTMVITFYSIQVVLDLFGVCLSLFRLKGVALWQIGRAVQQECRDRSRMPSSA
eukprot:TRINITY_DN92634_c0_g2_i3.p1 TRINITY_DN92634_c0_g2~~TRINITY_DN92634_c0_g2_i3.p1  ORF type:complete len:100 (+),score=14.11 TRINITY_DN92634_c0_g2_i3:180-479(+)